MAVSGYMDQDVGAECSVGRGRRTVPNARDKRINRLIERALAVSLSSQGQTLKNRADDLETEASRAHKMPDWEQLKERAWKNYR